MKTVEQQSLYTPRFTPRTGAIYEGVVVVVVVAVVVVIVVVVVQCSS